VKTPIHLITTHTHWSAAGNQLQYSWYTQVSAVADEPERCAASWQTCCKQRWTLRMINLRPN